MSNVWDIIIIGGGPAGITAAIYTARAGMSTLVIEKAHPGGQLWWSESIENYPGFPNGISSMDLAGNIEKQARNFGAEFISEEIKKIEKAKGCFKVETESGKELSACGIVIATGAAMKQLGVKGENKFLGKGVSYCAVCDGPLFRDKTVAVIGGGNTACEEAEYLTRFASKVYLIHRRPELRAVQMHRQQVEENEKIELLLEKEIEEIKGDGTVNALNFKDGTSIDLDGVFIFVGLSPSTGYLKDFVDMEHGFVITDEKLMTSVKGVFAAGDCRKGSFRQVVTACGEGAFAGEETRKYIEKKKGISYDW
jgi:thioredoxin reductase (NADPH)